MRQHHLNVTAVCTSSPIHWNGLVMSVEPGSRQKDNMKEAGKNLGLSLSVIARLKGPPIPVQVSLPVVSRSHPTYPTFPGHFAG